SYFFFFQAEDGIRDFHVTGVQTCALPISIFPTPAIGSRTLCAPYSRRIRAKTGRSTSVYLAGCRGMASTVTFVTSRIKSAPLGHAQDADLARSAPLNAAHPLALHPEQVELSIVPVGGQVHLIQRHQRPMQIRLIQHPAQARPNLTVEVHR